MLVTWSVWACPEVWLIYPVRLHWRNLIFPLQIVVYYRKLLNWGWEPMPTSPSLSWDPLWLEPVWVHYVLSQSVSSYVYEFIWTSALLCLQTTVSLV